MRCIVLIASHQNVPLREQLLERALRSIRTNTISPDAVYISYSTEKNLPFSEQTIKKYRDLFSPLYLYFHPQRKLQFEHFHFLTQFVNDTDIVCFLDDDDIYLPNKIKVTREIFTKNIDIMMHKVRSFCKIDHEMEISESSGEYCSYALLGKIFKQFFIEFFDPQSKIKIENWGKFTGYTDLCFGRWIKLYHDFYTSNHVLLESPYSNHERKYD